MNIPGLTESIIRSHASAESFERGAAYCHDGAVRALHRRDAGQVTAHVQGSQAAPYHVEIRHNAAAITEARCSCPYFAGSWCKHIVAALLACLRQAGTDGAASLSTLLENMERPALVRLVERLAERDPALAAWIRQTYGDAEDAD